jgi:hypothetical protein
MAAVREFFHGLSTLCDLQSDTRDSEPPSARTGCRARGRITGGC